MSETAFPLRSLPKVSCRLGQDGTLLWVLLNAPPGNVLDSEMLTSLRRVVEAAVHLPALRVIAFAGEGRHFSYGASVEEHLPERVAGMLELFHGFFRDLMEASLPTAAVVRGRCLGGGLELAAFCDRVVVEAGATLGQPEIKLGVFAPLGSLLLPWRCGARANRLLLGGIDIDAATALEWGLADEVTAEGEGAAAVERWLREELLPISASSLRFARRASRWWLDRALREALPELTDLYVQGLMGTRDPVEGLKAFLEKRKPSWTHA